MPKPLWLCLLVLSAASTGRAEEIPAKQKEAIDKGLKWLAKTQAADGHWDADRWIGSVGATGQAGMAFLMEGSTTQKGKYADNVRKAVDWLIQRSQADGCLREPPMPAKQPLVRGGGAREYVRGHGAAMLFLGSVYAQEKDPERRKKLKDVLTRAVDFAAKAQTTRGGWGYAAGKEGADFDAGECALMLMQGLAACHRAGISGAEPIMTKGMKYLEKCTTTRGGVVFSLAGIRGEVKPGSERPNLTIAAIVCSFSAGEYESNLVKKWIGYCKYNIPIDHAGALERACYTQVMFILGDNGYQALFPASQKEERLTWSKYQKILLRDVVFRQLTDGNWNDARGPVFATAENLMQLQLETSTLPIYRRIERKKDKSEDK